LLNDKNKEVNLPFESLFIIKPSLRPAKNISQAFFLLFTYFPFELYQRFLPEKTKQTKK